jgi:hypothetical protein
MSEGMELTVRQQELARIGERYLEALAPGLDFGVEALADEGAVYVWQLGFGGNQLIVGDDGSLLFGTSALWRDPMIESWRAGRRTSAADLDAAAAARRQG